MNLYLFKGFFFLNLLRILVCMHVLTAIAKFILIDDSVTHVVQIYVLASQNFITNTMNYVLG